VLRQTQNAWFLLLGPIVFFPHALPQDFPFFEVYWIWSLSSSCCLRYPVILCIVVFVDVLVFVLVVNVYVGLVIVSCSSSLLMLYFLFLFSVVFLVIFLFLLFCFASQSLSAWDGYR
jgi:hypothetical protein